MGKEPVDPNDPAFLVDFAKSDIERAQREQQLCVGCFLYKHHELFRPGSQTCKECEDE